MVWSRKEMDSLDVIQNKAGRIALGGNKYTAVEAIRGDMGWSTFRERIAKAGLRYRARVIRMDVDRWASKVLDWNICGKWMMGLTKVKRWLGEPEMFIRGEMIHGNMAVCKRIINRMVERKGKEEWQRGMSEKSTLEWYRIKDQPRGESYHDGSYGGDLLFRARTKSLEVNSRVYRWRNEGSKTCLMCDRGVDETVEHVVLECERYEDARARMLEVVIGELGVETWNDMRQENTNKQIVYLLGLCEERGSNFRIVDSMKNYLEIAWSERRRVTERRGGWGPLSNGGP